MTNTKAWAKARALTACTAAVLAPLVGTAGCGDSAPPAQTAQNGAYPQQQYPQQQAPQGYPQQQYPQQQAPQGYPQQQAPQGYPQQQYPQQPAAVPTVATAPAPAGAPTAAPTTAPTAPLGSVITTDPNQLAQLFQQAAAAGAAVLQQPGAVPGDPVELGLKAAALKYAPNMQPEGQIAKGTLAANGHLAFMVPMQPGKCYTIIGVSPPGQVKNLDLHLLAPPFYTYLAGQDTTDSNVPVIGGPPKAMCPVIPFALTYKVDIEARTGTGAVGVQVYSKDK